MKRRHVSEYHPPTPAQIEQLTTFLTEPATQNNKLPPDLELVARAVEADQVYDDFFIGRLVTQYQQRFGEFDPSSVKATSSRLSEASSAAAPQDKLRVRVLPLSDSEDEQPREARRRGEAASTVRRRPGLLSGDAAPSLRRSSRRVGRYSSAAPQDDFRVSVLPFTDSEDEDTEKNIREKLQSLPPHKAESFLKELQREEVEKRHLVEEEMRRRQKETSIREEEMARELKLLQESRKTAYSQRREKATQRRMESSHEASERSSMNAEDERLHEQEEQRRLHWYDHVDRGTYPKIAPRVIGVKQNDKKYTRDIPPAPTFGLGEVNAIRSQPTLLSEEQLLEPDRKLVWQLELIERLPLLYVPLLRLITPPRVPYAEVMPDFSERTLDELKARLKMEYKRLNKEQREANKLDTNITDAQFRNATGGTRRKKSMNSSKSRRKRKNH